MVSGVVEGVRDLGFDPFVFPAMGSHAGATAEGQAGMLAKMGVSEGAIGCDIRSSMSVEQLGEPANRGVPVVADAQAVPADAIVPVNRVKPHTDFDGRISGLSKIITIGMWKQRGAKIAHEWAVDWSLREMIPENTERLLDELPILGAVAVIGDERTDTTIIERVPAGGLLDRERELLEVADERMPTRPFDVIDVLIVDALGKDQRPGDGHERDRPAAVRDQRTRT